MAVAMTLNLAQIAKDNNMPSIKVKIKAQYDVTPGWAAKLMDEGYRVLFGVPGRFGQTKIIVTDTNNQSISFFMRNRQSMPLATASLNEEQKVIVNKLIEFGAAY
jgi:hypothetical protein